MSDKSCLTTDCFWFIIAVIASGLTLPILKQYILTNNKYYVIVAILLHLLLILSYIQLLYNHKVATIYPLIKISAIIIIVLLGILYLGEKLNIYNASGIALGFVSIYLLS